MLPVGVLARKAMENDRGQSLLPSMPRENVTAATVYKSEFIKDRTKDGTPSNTVKINAIESDKYQNSDKNVFGKVNLTFRSRSYSPYRNL